MVENTSENSAPYVCFLTDKESISQIKSLYDKRWQIEVFFKHVKTNGYNLEDMNLKNISRIQVLIAAVSLAYSLALIAGIVEHKKRPIKLLRNKAGTKTWLSVSIFRYGLQYLKMTLKTIEAFVSFIIKRISSQIIINEELMKKLNKSV